MINAISPQVNIPYSTGSASSAVSGGGAEVATLQRELVSYDKQLSNVQDGTVEAGAVQTQLLSAQVSLLTAQIVSLSGVTPVSFTQPAPASPAAVGQSGAPSGTASAAPVATATVAAAQQPVPTPSATTSVSDQAALSQAQATLSSIFQKVSAHGASPPPPTSPAQTAGESTQTAGVPTPTTGAPAQTASQAPASSAATSQSAASVSVGSTINVTV